MANNIATNGHPLSSRSFVRVSLYIISVCMRLVLLSNFSSLPRHGVKATLDHPVLIKLVHVCTIKQSPSFLVWALLSVIVRYLFCCRDRSLLLPSLSLAVTIFYHLVRGFEPEL